jgi:NAD(P)-dependent dehydrogenase (short-subunit alcohol dehydrogenase family)
MSRTRRPIWPLAVAMLGVWGLSRALRRWRLDTHRGYFEGKVVLITGGSRGIGRVLAHAFAQRGASVALAARSVAQLEQVAAECEALNPRVETLIVPTDVTSEAGLDYLVEETLARF